LAFSVTMNLFLDIVTPLLKKGTESPVTLADLAALDLLAPAVQTEQLHATFQAEWQQQRSLHPPHRVSLWQVMLSVIGYPQLALGLCLSMLSGACAFGPPLLLKYLSEHFSGVKEQSDTTLWVFVVLLLLFPVVGSVCMAHSYVIYSNAAAMARNSLIPAIYRKILVLGNSSRAKFSSGQVLNLFSVDINSIQLFVVFFSSEIFGPFQLAVALALLYEEVGVAMFAGLGMVVVTLPVLIVTFVLYSLTKQKKLRVGDVRIKMTSEVLNGIRVIKYYAWELPFEEKVAAIRNVELSLMLKMNIILTLIIMLITSIPYVMPMVMFYTFSQLGNSLDVARAFTTLALIGLVTGPITSIPSFLQRLFSARISMQRILDFLLSDEIESYISSLPSPSPSDGGGDEMPSSGGAGAAAAPCAPPIISMQNASFSWAALPSKGQEKGQEQGQYSRVDTQDAQTAGGEEEEGRRVEMAELQATATQVGGPEEEGAAASNNRAIHTLEGLNISIPRGSLTAIVGSVGSGYVFI
jgi:ATP-binding cassette, subfamily C (CFTR/MRP), member 1